MDSLGWASSNMTGIFLLKRGIWTDRPIGKMPYEDKGRLWGN
jgi:hypothetical protein